MNLEFETYLGMRIHGGVSRRFPQKSLKFYKRKELKKPSITICHTIKGKGFPFSENNPFWHHKNNFTENEKKEMKSFLL